MNKIEEQLAKFQKIDIWEIVKEILIELSGTIIEMNQSQLLQGKMSDGSGTPQHTLGPISEIYVANKIEDGKYDSSIFPNWNYFNEGSFFENFVVKVENDSILIFSNDEKGGELITEIGGANAYGVTNENLDFLIRMIIPTMNQRIRMKLGY